MSAAILVFTRDPQGFPIWLPQAVADTLRVCRGDQLTREQYSSDAIQGMLHARAAESGPRKDDHDTSDLLEGEHR